MDEIYLTQETKLINQKKKQQKKLQRLEVDILESLKQTYAKQQTAIEEIHDIMAARKLESDRKMLTMHTNSPTNECMLLQGPDSPNMTK